ncbi:LytR family transcriptional regulator [Paraclostridium benzoelyticum]|uniref:LytR family transcriptional regulator n=1 Tax=Paraclostridium benzoelyticum TaxID=1629550 RepID=A0A0M3DLB5_9FIRM|nr:LCP family protein [Paraclostridium benzoelyticum]KKY02177.1 LytR family transcriptional regulator [Paraclostridium benzoelyticum]OXX84635.1 LytR family transcriptional regulator [Paraclostridium benzoelyticum]
MSKLKKIVIALIILVVLLPASAFGYVYFKLDSIYDKNTDIKALNKTDYRNEKGITNILLVGTDSRTENDKGSRSDAMMILTIDQNHKNIKLTSLARDLYVDIPGHGKQKLTHAYAYGGINLLIETIEKNLELDIQNYATVDFFSFMGIIDEIGGVSVNVKEGELSQLKKYTEQSYNLYKNPNKGDLEFITNAGTHKLNGYQALGYTRIRYNDTAAERDRRQREVMESIFNSISDLSISKYPSLIDTLLPYIKTNMKPTQIIALGTKVLSMGNFSMIQMEFPPKPGEGGILGNAGWVLQFDPDINNTILHDFVFENKIPTNE